MLAGRKRKAEALGIEKWFLFVYFTLMFDPDWQGKYEETGQDWVYWENSVSKEISSATETVGE